MTISELIALLEEAREHAGDSPVMAYDADAGAFTPVTGYMSDNRTIYLQTDEL